MRSSLRARAPVSYQRELKKFSARLGVVKCSALRAVVEFEIVEKVIDDFSVVEADLRKGASADLDDFMNVALATGIGIVDCRIVWIAGLRPRGGLHPAQRSLMAVHAARFDGAASEASLYDR
jgi:hypothetical protein